MSHQTAELKREEKVTAQKAMQVAWNRERFTDVKTAGFTQSGTANSIDGVPINRKDARIHLSMTRKKSPKATPDKNADAKANGYIKIRSFHLKAGLLLIPYTETEMRNILIDAKDEFDEDDILSIDTVMRLTTAGYDIDQLTRMWRMMSLADVDTTSTNEDQPLNTFGTGETPDNG